MTPFSPRMALMIFLGLLPQQTCLVLPSAARPAARKSTALNVMLRQRDTQHIWAGVDTMNKFERLAAEEELELGRQVQAALLLDQLRYDDDGKPLSADKWAAAAGVSVEELVAALERAQAARRVLILSNLRLAASVARKFVGRGLTFEELVQEGVMGMDRAVTLFDPSRKVRFSTYAIQWIEQRIRMALKRCVEREWQDAVVAHWVTDAAFLRTICLGMGC
uniref:RNA polymerase sigma-70 region 2 domain-containing protein n=1 Tax=Pinguiococcus pyrenoidosus TaxID=172671 RepID=A0A7R9Y999_9STRA|mmetsp:Transcript_13341/g.49572  ORF Transcript_13341/g.49572 Transcript_13341/m.49572 type:complete len:221 (+) Transcript_13341:203-865(+)